MSTPSTKSTPLSVMMQSISEMRDKDAVFPYSITINFLRNFTIEQIEPILKYYLYLEQIRPNISFSNYNTILQDICDKNSFLYQQDDSDSRLTILSIYLGELAPNYNHPDWNIKETMESLQIIFDNILEHLPTLVGVNTFIPPFYSETGLITGPKHKNLTEKTIELNQFVRETIKQNSSRLLLLDWERLARICGEENSIDYRYWYAAKAPFKKPFLELYAKEITKVARAILGKTKKCLVLDCDHTLWGGIVGEDGPENIQLHPYDYPGNVFYEFQKTLLFLQQRGVILALCSKNNEADVLEILNQHPNCLLKLHHFAAARVNWESKPDNLTSLISELNINPESIVFLDDDPAERQLIQSSFPQISVLAVPDNLPSYPQLLLREGLFDALFFTKEDAHRTALYQNDILRKQEKGKHHNSQEYLASLQMVATIHPLLPQEIKRVAQLLQRTNQFNVSTRRHTEPEVSSFLTDPDVGIFTLTLKDKFGDLGLVSVLIVKKKEDFGVVDTFLQSCRTIGRGLEDVFLRYCFESLEQKWNVKRWQAEYIPTSKNQLVQNLWERYGFIKASNDQSGYTIYEVEAGKYRFPKSHFIELKTEE